MPGLVKITDADTFKAAIQAPELTLIHFAADWAEQCSQIDDFLEALSKRPDNAALHFYTLQAESLPEISLENNIVSVPVVVLYRSGKFVDRIEGTDPAKITEKVKEHSGGTATTTNATSLEDRLKSLINRAPIMLFMKGDRFVPRCGFSRQMIQILNDTGAKYETFDILSDEEVRQGLKTYSDWPTYPQLYVKGELIGGLDIVKEMLAGGDLAAALNG